MAGRALPAVCLILSLQGAAFREISNSYNEINFKFLREGFTYGNAA